MSNLPARSREKKLRPDGTEYSDDPKKRHAELVEDGKIGAKGSELAKAQGRMGGRPRRVRASEKVAQKVQENADKIWNAFESALDEDQPARLRLEAAQAALKVERDEANLQMEEDEHYDKMTHSELVEELVSQLSDPMVQAMLSDAPQEVIVDAEAVEWEPEDEAVD